MCVTNPKVSLLHFHLSQVDIICAINHGLFIIAIIFNVVEKCSSYPCVIFEDNFDKFDFDVWQHEITAGGGGVS